MFKRDRRQTGRTKTMLSRMRRIVFGVVMASCSINGPLAAERPNVVLIMTDDQGYGDFGATGNEVIETPNLDALAAESASVTNFYVSPVCSPTRACLMTGRYNLRTRCIDTWLGRSMLEPDEVTVAEVMSEAGYRTGIFGKWHLGDCYPMRPNDQGFRESLIHRGGGLAQPSEPRENQRRYTNPILFRNGEQVQTKGYCTDVYFDAGIEFIEQSHAAGENFFVYLPTNAPHSPYHDVPVELLEHYRTKRDELEGLIVGSKQNLEQQVDRLARISAMITNVDQNVGRLLATLKRLGVSDNTLVIFLVDNGPNTMRYVDGFRGMKTQVHEGGIRSPLWMHWPAKWKHLKTGQQLAAHIDLMPTILDACDIAPPPNVKLDGRSLLPLLGEDAPPWEERELVIQAHRGDEAVRYHHFMIRRGPWKLLHPSGFQRERFQGKPDFELYHLGRDPGERNNVVDDERQIREELIAAYDRWFDDVSQTRPDNFAPPRIKLGTPFENPTVLTRQDWRGGAWRQGAVGHWMVDVEKKGPYQVLVHLEPFDRPGELTLRIGETTREAKVPSHAKQVKLDDVALPTGPGKLECIVEFGELQRGVYQIDLSLE